MPTPTEFQSRYGTALATFTQTGTYSNTIFMGGLAVVGLYSPDWPSAAGSLTFRSSFDAGTGYQVANESGIPYRVTPFGSGTFYDLSPGTVLTTPYLTIQVGTAGTAGVAAGGTIVVVGLPYV